MLGGVEMDGETLFSQALEEQQRLEEQIQLAWKATYAELPSTENVQPLLNFMDTQIEQFKSEDAKLDDQAAQRKAFEVLCQALLGSNQFLYID